MRIPARLIATLSAIGLAATGFPRVAECGGGGEWRRTLPPARTADFATAYDDLRREWVLAGMGGTATRGEVWVTPASSANWRSQQAGNRIASGVTPVFSAWDRAADRLVVLLLPFSPSPLVAWEFSRGAGDRWRALDPTGEAPSWRDRPMVAHDPAGRRIFVLGGYDGGHQVPDDVLWILSLEPTPHWTRPVIEGPRPLPRAEGAMAFDPGRQLLVLYGGTVRTGESSYRSHTEDVWFLDLAAEPARWRQVAETSPGPGPGDWSELLADPARDRILTFSGPAQGDGVWEMPLATPGSWRQIGSGTPNSLIRTVGQVPDEDAIVLLTSERVMWRLDLAAGRWTAIDPGSGPWPDDWRSTLALDPRDGSILAITAEAAPPGEAPSVVEFQVARYVPGDLGRWEILDVQGDPPNTSLGNSVWDPVRRHWLFLGGAMDAAGRSGHWTLATEPALAWTFVPIAGPGPVDRRSTALHDRDRDRLVLVEEDPATRGVFQEASSRSRVWTLTFGSQPAWKLEEVIGPVPAGRFDGALVYDDRRDRMILVGGERLLRSGSPAPRGYDDVWALGLARPFAWQELVPRNSPLPMAADAGVDIDPGTDRLRILGGHSFDRSEVPSPMTRDTLRTLDLSTNTFDPAVPPTGFEGIPVGKTMFDPVAGRAVHFFAKNVWEWRTEPRHDVRVTFTRGRSAGNERMGRDRAPIELVVLGADRFDPRGLDGATVRLAGVPPDATAATGHRPSIDVDHDGFEDRTFLFHGIEPSSTEALEFRARTHAGIPVVGFARLAAPRPARAMPLEMTGMTAVAMPLSARLRGGPTAGVLIEGGSGTRVDLDVFDVRGRHLWRASRERTRVGALTVDLPPSVSPTPGIRFVRVRAGDEVRVLRHVTLD